MWYYLSVPMNAAAIEFRKHAMLGSRGQWGQRLRALLAGAGVSPGTGVGVQLCVADPNYLDDLLYLALIFLLSHTTPSTNRQFEPFHLHRLTPASSERCGRAHLQRPRPTRLPIAWGWDSSKQQAGAQFKMADSAADLEAHPHQQGGAKQTAKDLFSGAAGGVAQVLLGKVPWTVKPEEEAQWHRVTFHMYMQLHMHLA